MRTWTPRQWAAAVAVALVAGVAIGVPTEVVPTPFYARMTPVLWWNYPVWAVSSLLMGLLVATCVGQPSAVKDSGPCSRRAVVAGLLSAFAVGCPICNKLVVLAIGVSGALLYWAPAQPFLAVASMALLVHALVRRLRMADACPVPSTPSAYDLGGRPSPEAYDNSALVPGGSRPGGEGSGRASAG
ncbi:hypothetical protein [Streptomyces chiangmaiensis]|uniref:Integral membrane protein n=1 Tax=Streptomyces chiangmaiensis TaxID=766497 RepID=A0ABU7FUR6_9ACTN|nr:hypothetical protein [Streptomyces chiangmaiensis]MED7827804.1 hypothetical protein [Streptomyces chiangmaiensis]